MSSHVSKEMGEDYSRESVQAKLKAANRVPRSSNRIRAYQTGRDFGILPTNGAMLRRTHADKYVKRMDDENTSASGGAAGRDAKKLSPKEKMLPRRMQKPGIRQNKQPSNVSKSRTAGRALHTIASNEKKAQKASRRNGSA
jgi:hypothetical protein